MTAQDGVEHACSTHKAGFEWNLDTDFPVFLDFRLRHLDENGRNLYNYICICSPNMRRQGTYFTKKKVTRASACGTRFCFAENSIPHA